MMDQFTSELLGLNDKTKGLLDHTLAQLRVATDDYAELLRLTQATHRRFLGACVIAGASIIVNVILFVVITWGRE